MKREKKQVVCIVSKSGKDSKSPLRDGEGEGGGLEHETVAGVGMQAGALFIHIG